MNLDAEPVELDEIFHLSFDICDSVGSATELFCYSPQLSEMFIAWCSFYYFFLAPLERKPT
jgi:hypothetical protein